MDRVYWLCWWWLVSTTLIMLCTIIGVGHPKDLLEYVVVGNVLSGTVVVVCSRVIGSIHK